jgi:hypothetical protein
MNMRFYILLIFPHAMSHDNFKISFYLVLYIAVKIYICKKNKQLKFLKINIFY